MKNLIVLFLLSLATCVQAQETKETTVYKYIIVQPESSSFSDKVELKIDDGTEIRKAKDKDNKTITFRTSAAGLMYLTLQGWELVSNYTKMDRPFTNGTGNATADNYWIFRKPASYEEVQEIVDKSIRKKKEE